MRKRRLKRFVLPTIYVLIVVASFLSIGIINNLLISNIDDYDYFKGGKFIYKSVIMEQDLHLIENENIQPARCGHGGVLLPK